ncbi:MAG TPA: Gfo/Idh/MocA family oxidoreductase [Phycisphaerae bacterium]|nr:Gfo/Idh/MocA family oxidoreductase [Phycisphaerae bacterium]HPS53072.1 Gfo/Idh/MocA family oxidoreductase [Phycisphaerae bacterium]
MRTVKFGIIGCGLMGREFASACARWFHLLDMKVRPEIVAICDTSDDLLRWYADNIPTIRQVTKNYKELLANDEVQAVYIAVPHNLHQEFFCASVEAGKHLLGEKPFGMDEKANMAIMECCKRHPDVFVRCSSESIFFPAMQKIGALIESGGLGKIIEANSGFLHSSDLDFTKPINWKRMLKFNGEYGCMGDLGMHACHMPFRAGWIPQNVRAVLSDIVKERPDGRGGMAPCETWDNATLLCETKDSAGETFPMTIRTHRIAPGNKNTWYFEVYGTRASARWSSRQINTLEVLKYDGGEQSWQVTDMGHEMAFKSLTGGIFEAGFSDSILQMWAAFLYELTEGRPKSRFAGCVTPQEVSVSHRLFTSALESQANQTTVSLW